MTIEISEVTVVALILGLIVLAALWNRRGVRMRVSPQNLELDIDNPPVTLRPRGAKQVAEAGLEPARELPPTGF